MEINKVHHIDCFDGFKLLADNSVDHILTSPPYNRKRNDKYEHHVDIMDDYFGFLCKTIDESLRVSKGFVFFNIMKNYYNKQDVFKLIGNYSDKIIDIFIWETTNPLPASGKNITNAYEFFIIFGNGSLKSNTTYTKNIISTAVNSKMTKEHKAIMKQEVADWFVEKFTKEGDVILDPFIGAGTTAISCINLNRNYIGFELESQYVELSNSRIKKTIDGKI
jgi:site-specific DNA-methyltransferase (adenine-specific)